MRPFICVSAHAIRQAGGVRQLQLSCAYTDAITAAGGIPIIAAETAPGELARLCGGLLLSGGDDVSPAFYGQVSHTDTLRCDPQRDAFEFALTRAFLVQNKPILGICRGCQVLNCVLGGTLHQDLPSSPGVNHADDRLRHLILCREDSVLARGFGPRFRVNSTHHQAVRDIAPSLTVTARSADGIIEAFEAQDARRLLWGVQFHPERLTGALRDARTPDFAPLFRAFAEAAQAK